jgi:hypothetical protein
MCGFDHSKTRTEKIQGGVMSDIKTMKEMITGLETKKKNLRANESVFLKLSGINEEIEKANQDKIKHEKELTEAKEHRDNLKNKKSAAVAETTAKIEREMNKVLPSGRAVFAYSQDEEEKFNMTIGWNDDKKTTPYNGLSGGQKQIFDAALANVLDANIIVVEAAELDSENLVATLKELSKLDKQMIVNTCHPVNEVPEPFKQIEV